MRVTADDVARAAGVSRAMVSRAFTDGASISVAKRTHVRAVAEELGYHPNLIARGLTGSRTGLVAVVVGAVARPYEAWLLEHLGQAVRKTGSWPLLIQVGPDDEVDSALENALAYQVDGAIVAAGSVSKRLAERCKSVGVPVVLVGRILNDESTDSVCCDNRQGMAEIADFLVARGRRKIAWIGGTADTFSNVERFSGLKIGLAAQGLEVFDIRQGDYSPESGLAQGLALLTSPQLPDAIVCGNDAMAMGVMDAARRLKIAVPDQISIIGFDDIPAAGWDPYLLTTLRNPVQETVDAALELLMSRIADDTQPFRSVRLTAKLIVRSSA